MDEQRKKLEAIGDGLLLACARLYLRDHHPSVSYRLYARLVSRMIRNTTLAEIAKGEGIKGHAGEPLQDALEVAFALRYYRDGFESLRVWLFGLFDKYVSIPDEVRKILEPPPEDRLFKSVRGALKTVIGQQGGKVTGSNLDEVSKQVVRQVRSNGGL